MILGKTRDVFSLLHERIRDLLPELGIQKPTLVQRLAIPKLISSNSNAIIVAPTGSGKTEAALLPLLSKLLWSSSLKPLSILYITPLRSLNRDILRRLARLAKKLGLSAEIRHSDTPQTIRRKQTIRPPVLLITTPETLNIILWSHKLRPYLRNVRYLVIDEVHEIGGSKRGVQLALALERVKMLCDDPQIVLLSATVSNPMDVLRYFTGGCGGIIIDARESKKYVLRVLYARPKLEPGSGCLIVRPNLADVISKIISILGSLREKTIIFTNTRDMAEVLAACLSRALGLKMRVHHSSVSRDIRVETENAIRVGRIRTVIATSSLELGIDIGGVEHVIQVGSPRRVEVALQRIGRSGHRVGGVSRGTIITMTPDDFLEALSIVTLAERGIVEPVNLIFGSYDVLAHQIIGIVRDFMLDGKGYPAIREIYEIVRRAYPYRDLSYESFLSVCKFLDRMSRALRIESGRLRLRRGSIKLYFENVSMIPRSSKFLVVDIASRRRIGELDEQYVLSLSPGNRFILSGRCWEVLRVDAEHREVTVKGISGLSEPPSWVGELMPVSFIVAQNVGRLRRILAQGEYAWATRYTPNWECLEKFFAGISEPPDDRNIVAEYDISPLVGGTIIIHSCAGDRVNRALGALIFKILLEETSLPVVEYRTDPYRIYIRVYPGVFSEDDVRSALVSAFEKIVRLRKSGMLLNSLKDSVRGDLRALSWTFLNVIRRLGLIGDEPVPWERVVYLARRFSRTIAIEEAVNEYVWTRMDPENLDAIISMLERGQISLTVRRGLSRLANQNILLLESAGDRVAIGRGALEEYKRRLARRRVKLLCLQCGFHELRRVSDGPWSECPRCSSKLFTVSKAFDFSEFLVEKLKRGAELSVQERRRLNALYTIGMMLRSDPERVMLAIAASGVGLQCAIRLLQERNDIYDLLEALREYESRFARLRIF